ncbi:protein kinase [Streptomyces sp. NPDC051211]|uniref:serine/threonine-protein kinase n=1 Tax=Streptomyces sp. NPDC051211 TaxID=3154643 RepID=UPI003450FFA2
MTLRDGDPRSIGGYVLIDRLGSGGMGTVYTGRAASGRLVAVKLVHQQFADDPEFRTRFRQEIAAARRVSGAFTAPVVDADPDAARPWMATQLVPGQTLGTRVKTDGPLRGSALRVLALGLVEALRELHTTGVIHRDLKPDNVLLTDDGPRVIDFGISRAAGQQTLTSTGQILGTPPFMSPEQLSAPQRVTAASDVFSLGSVLVFATTGRGPFDADSHYMTAYRVVSEAPYLGDLAGALRAVVESCLAKEPAARPGPGELLAALAEIPAAVWESPLGPAGGAEAVPAAVGGVGGSYGRSGSGAAAGAWAGTGAGAGAETGAGAGAETGAGAGAGAGPAGGNGTGSAAGAAAGSAAETGAGNAAAAGTGELTRRSGPPTGPAGPADPAARRGKLRRPGRRGLIAGVLAASLLAGGGVYLGLTRPDDGPVGDRKGSQAATSPPGSPSPSRSPAPAGPAVTGVLAPYVATDGGNPAGSHAYADSPARRPAHWRPWSGAAGAGPCVYADSSLICTKASPDGTGLGTLTRYDAATGLVLWMQDVNVQEEGPVVSGDTVIVLGDRGFTAVAMADGAIRGQNRTEKKLRRLVLDTDGSRAYAVDLDGTVTAVETRAGQKVWRTAVPGSEDGYPALRAAGGRVYVQGRSQNPDMGFQTFVAVLDGATGKRLPAGPAPRNANRFALAGPCGSRGLAVAQTGSGPVTFLCHRESGPSVLRGEPAKDAAVDIPYGGSGLSGLAAAGGRAYLMASSLNGEPAFMELNQESGGAHWRIPLPSNCAEPERPEAANAVVVTDGLAYVRCLTSGVVIDLAGRKKIKEFDIPGGLRAGPDGPAGFLVAGGVVFTPTAKGWSAVEPVPL